jgi:hypothetical protein
MGGRWRSETCRGKAVSVQHTAVSKQGSIRKTPHGRIQSATSGSSVRRCGSEVVGIDLGDFAHHCDLLTAES